MRLRNIPRAESVLEACKEVVKDPESLRGDWNQTFKKRAAPAYRDRHGKRSVSSDPGSPKPTDQLHRH